MTPQQSIALAARISACLAPLKDRFALAAACVLRREAKDLPPYEVNQLIGGQLGETDLALKGLASAEAVHDDRFSVLVGPIERIPSPEQGPSRYRIRPNFEDDPAMRAFLAAVDAVEKDLNHRAATPPPDHPAAYTPKKSRQ